MTRTILSAGRLFDGHQAIESRCWIAVEEGTIVGVGRGNPVASSADKMTDWGSACISPGLVDCHVHLCLSGELDAVNRMIDRSREDLLEKARASARTQLAAGITTVRDLGDRDYVALTVRDECAKEPSAGPTILASGPPITTIGGHGWFFGGEVPSEPEFLVDAVHRRLAAGCDLIKVMASGGEVTRGSHPWESQFGLKGLEPIVATARDVGLRVAAHAHGLDSIRDLVTAGVDTIEHCSFRTKRGVMRDDRLLNYLVRRGVGVVSTAAANPSARQLTSDAERRFGDILHLIRELISRGHPVACASDAGISDQKDHPLLVHAALMMERAGVPAYEVIRRITSIAAGMCNLPAKGTVSIGADADLLVSELAPWRDLSTLLHPIAVYRDGVQVN